MATLASLHIVLDALEEEEAKLLTWGDTNGSFTERQILALIEKILPKEDP